MYPMFFFASRRRHTRYWRDWSSDVCSSDLSQRDQETLALVRVRQEHEGHPQTGRQAFREGGDVVHLLRGKPGDRRRRGIGQQPVGIVLDDAHMAALCDADRKSTRLNSSHANISYAVFCLKKKEHTSELQSR